MERQQQVDFQAQDRFHANLPAGAVESQRAGETQVIGERQGRHGMLRRRASQVGWGRQPFQEGVTGVGVEVGGQFVNE